MRRWRSLLYVPGVQERMLAKAPSLGADGLILDLEASVPPAEKGSDDQVLSFVAGNELAVGYVSDGAHTDNVKVLRVE